jgi:hypothetical protein
MNLLKQYIAILFVSLFSFSMIENIYAEDNKESKKNVVAKVNNIFIDAEEFKLNYEFGFPHLKVGKTLEEKKNSYLNFMINEKILALEAEQIGLLNSNDFIESMKKIEKGILLQQFVNKEIKEKIEVTFEEASEYLNKSKVLVKIILWPETSFEDAKIVKSLLDKNGLEKTVQIISSENPNLNIKAEQFETDYLSAAELPAELFEQISNLPAGVTSEPIKIGDNYYLVNVKDIRRNSITEKEYADKYPSIRKVLFSRKVQERLSFFVDSLLAPKNIRTDKEQFNLLIALIKNWKTENKEKSLSLENYVKKSVLGSDGSINLLNPESIIVKYEQGQMKISEFINYLSFDLIPEEEILNENFPATLNQVIGISIRDYFLINYANENNYTSDTEVKNELNKWRSKLAYDEYKKYLQSDKKLSAIEISSTLENETKKLRSKYHITIYDEVLNYVVISETEKSSKGFYQIYLSGINRMAQPIVDGNWKQQ